MRLYLVQHGEAENSEVDPERPLSPRGRSDLQSMARFLEGEIAPRRIYHSGKRRAEQSAALLAVNSPSAELKAVGNIGPNDPVGSLLAAIGSWHDDTVIVGHLPFMGRLVASLLGGDPEQPPVSFQPGSVVALERGCSGRWSLQWMVRPELLHN